MTLTEFLLARIADDEALAHFIIDGDHWHGIGVNSATEVATHITRQRPTRVLAECEAKRRIVERASRDIAAADAKAPDQITRPFDAGAAHEAYNVLLDLARIWADHPDFREEWRQ